MVSPSNYVTRNVGTVPGPEDNLHLRLRIHQPAREHSDTAVPGLSGCMAAATS